MPELIRKYSTVVTKILPLTVLLTVYGCGQAPDETESAADATADPVAEPYVQERGVQSIDADGNVAPFGMASRQPVEIAEPEVAMADTATASTSGRPWMAHRP